MPTRNGVGRAGGLLDESQTFTRMVSSDPPCRWGAERRATARGRARATAHGDDDDRHERGAHPRCGAKNSRQSVRGDERAGAGARGAVIARDDARWRRDFEIRARARDARSNARCGAVDDARARRVTRDIFCTSFRAGFGFEERGRRVQVRERDARDGDGEQSFETTDGRIERGSARECRR